VMLMKNKEKDLQQIFGADAPKATAFVTWTKTNLYKKGTSKVSQWPWETFFFLVETRGYEFGHSYGVMGLQLFYQLG
jgi:hypothetical protein